MCGIIALFQPQASSNLIPQICSALCVLQHRGQDAAGISWIQEEDSKLYLAKGLGLVKDVFDEQQPMDTKAQFGIGHVRYPTSGGYSPDLAQPFFLQHKACSIALAHNGNLVNTQEITKDLASQGVELKTTSDSEVLLHVLAKYLPTSKPSVEQLFETIKRLHQDCIGAYAVTALLSGIGMLVFRDPRGIRPLVMGIKEGSNGKEYAFASESAALTFLGFEVERNIQAGEVVFIDTEGKFHSCIYAKDPYLTPCIFEHVYLARPDSTLDDIHIYKARLRQGEYLAKNIMSHYDAQNIDVVIPIPDTSRVSAQAAAEVMGIKMREGLIKNRYIGRTFIMPNQEMRLNAVRAKVSIIKSEVQNKRVLLVDDSIVRGTTSREIVRMVREAGAKEVYIASAAPEVKYPNIYGIDMPCQEDFIAYKRTNHKIAQEIGVDWVCYQTVEDLQLASCRGNPQIQNFECSIFTGQYVTGQPDLAYLKKLAQDRGNGERKTYG